MKVNQHPLAEKTGVPLTLGDRLFPVTTADTDAVDDISLLGLVTEAASLVRARGTGSAVDDVKLTILPAPTYGKDEVHL